jgi:hypothetical protein
MQGLTDLQSMCASENDWLHQCIITKVVVEIGHLDIVNIIEDERQIWVTVLRQECSGVLYVS